MQRSRYMCWAIFDGIRIIMVPICNRLGLDTSRCGGCEVKLVAVWPLQLAVHRTFERLAALKVVLRSSDFNFAPAARKLHSYGPRHRFDGRGQGGIMKQ